MLPRQPSTVPAWRRAQALLVETCRAQTSAQSVAVCIDEVRALPMPHSRGGQALGSGHPRVPIPAALQGRVSTHACAAARAQSQDPPHAYSPPLPTCSPDGQTFAVLASTVVRRGEFGLPDEVLPDDVFALEPVQGAEGVAMLTVLGNVGAP